MKVVIDGDGTLKVGYASIRSIVRENGSSGSAITSWMFKCDTCGQKIIVHAGQRRIHDCEASA